MAKASKKSAKEASETFHNIMKASVSGNPKPERDLLDTGRLLKIEKMLLSDIPGISDIGSMASKTLTPHQRKEMLERLMVYKKANYKIDDNRIIKE